VTLTKGFGMRIYNVVDGKLVINHAGLKGFRSCKVFIKENQIILEIDGEQHVLEQLDFGQIDSKINHIKCLYALHTQRDDYLNKIDKLNKEKEVLLEEFRAKVDKYTQQFIEDFEDVFVHGLI
jgi:hypothetical protein